MLKNLAFVVFVFQILFTSCGNPVSTNKIDESELPNLKVEVRRYGKALFELDTANLSHELKNLKHSFTYFLDANLDDPNNVKQIKDFISDTALIRIYKKTTEVYPNNDFLNTQLTSIFKYLKYYYPEFVVPQVFTYVSGMQYEQPIWIQDSVMVVALDDYLGGDFLPYSGLGLPKYKLRCMCKENLAVDVAKYVFQEYVSPKVKQNTLLDRMIAGGKMLYFLDQILPETPDSVKICYTKNQLQWTIKNEKNIWAFLIQNDLLYSSNYQSQAKLIQDAPFTTGFSRESPSRLGVWLGWQIVSDFMNNNPDVSLDDLFELNDSQQLLHKSKYKP
jgi:hypothetical protein